MLKVFICSCMIFFSFFMYFLNNPLSMGFMILLQTLLTCLISGMMINTYWFSYILFLTFLGGLLVLFLYVSSMASNEMFIISLNKFFIFISLFFMFNFISTLLINNMTWLNFNFNDEMNQLLNYNIFYNNENKINLTKLYNKQTFLLMIMMILYLFITLIAVVKITNIFYGPIRSSIF